MDGWVPGFLRNASPARRWVSLRAVGSTQRRAERDDCVESNAPCHTHHFTSSAFSTKKRGASKAVVSSWRFRPWSSLRPSHGTRVSLYFLPTVKLAVGCMTLSLKVHWM